MIDGDRCQWFNFKLAFARLVVRMHRVVTLHFATAFAVFKVDGVFNVVLKLFIAQLTQRVAHHLRLEILVLGGHIPRIVAIRRPILERISKIHLVRFNALGGRPWRWCLFLIINVAVVVQQQLIVVVVVARHLRDKLIVRHSSLAADLLQRFSFLGGDVDNDLQRRVNGVVLVRVTMAMTVALLLLPLLLVSIVDLLRLLDLFARNLQNLVARENIARLKRKYQVAVDLVQQLLHRHLFRRVVAAKMLTAFVVAKRALLPIAIDALKDDGGGNINVAHVGDQYLVHVVQLTREVRDDEMIIVQQAHSRVIVECARDKNVHGDTAVLEVVNAVHARMILNEVVVALQHDTQTLHRCALHRCHILSSRLEEFPRKPSINFLLVI
mmetsp:Transcript_18511/g.29375  ORF Transcript_18511/g.29375 Transcript_18511/m.29375 type:complete len:382 (+) Transcript_18511:489-1634(+)